MFKYMNLLYYNDFFVLDFRMVEYKYELLGLDGFLCIKIF